MFSLLYSDSFGTAFMHLLSVFHVTCWLYTENHRVVWPKSHKDEWQYKNENNLHSLVEQIKVSFLYTKKTNEYDKN